MLSVGRIALEKVLEQAVLASPLFTARWRWDAGRALAVLRFRNGKKVPPPIQRMRADDLLASVFPEAAACQENIVGEIGLPGHPLVREVMKDALHEALDVEGLKEILARMAAGEIRCLAIDTPVPSVFSHEILNANPYAYLDDAPLEERRARAVEMRRVLPEAVVAEVGRLDPAAIAEVSREAWPDARDPDELQDVLQTLIALPEGPGGYAPSAPDRQIQNRLSMLRVSFPLAIACPVLCDPALLPGGGEVGSAKMDAFLELLDEAEDDGHRMLVFSQFTSLLKLVRDELEARSLPFASIDGSMNARARQNEVDRFQASAEIPVFLISLKAGGTGLNLTGADTVVHFDPWWNPAVEAQATDRAHRIGQTRTVNVYKLIVAGTVEEKVLALQQDKARLLAGVFDESDAANARLSLDELRELGRGTES